MWSLYNTCTVSVHASLIMEEDTYIITNYKRREIFFLKTYDKNNITTALSYSTMVSTMFSFTYEFSKKVNNKQTALTKSIF